MVIQLLYKWNMYTAKLLSFDMYMTARAQEPRMLPKEMMV